MQCHRQDRHFEIGTLYKRPKIFNSTPADHGKKYEGKALQGNSLKTGKSVEQSGIQVSLGCSPDGLVGTDGVVEVKWR